jgi:hypothetical protein
MKKNELKLLIRLALDMNSFDKEMIDHQQYASEKLKDLKKFNSNIIIHKKLNIRL